MQALAIKKYVKIKKGLVATNPFNLSTKYLYEKSDKYTTYFLTKEL